MLTSLSPSASMPFINLPFKTICDSGMLNLPLIFKTTGPPIPIALLLAPIPKYASSRLPSSSNTIGVNPFKSLSVLGCRIGLKLLAFTSKLINDGLSFINFIVAVGTDSQILNMLSTSATASSLVNFPRLPLSYL